MKNPITKQIIEHLVFLGYKVDDKSGESKIDILHALSDSKSNLRLNIFNNNLILISANYDISDSNSIITLKFLDAINIANAKSMYSKVHYVEEKNKKIALIMETITIDYHKQTFVTMMDGLEREIQTYLRDLEGYYSSNPKVNYGQAIVDELMSTTKDKENISSRIGF